MKKLRNILVASLLTVGAFSALVMTSCNPDPCKDVVCSNGGTCTDGSCACPVGYEGETCATESRAKFVKSWSAADNDGTNNLVYTCAVANAMTVTNVIISNTFSDSYFVNNINASVNGNTITIPSQQPDNDGFAVAGTGTFSNNKIIWSYTITKVSTSQTITYTGMWL